MTTFACPYCGRRPRSTEGFRDHLATNTCGQVPGDVQVSIVQRMADTYTETAYVAHCDEKFHEAGWNVFKNERGRGRDGSWLTNTGTAGAPDRMYLRPPDLLFVEYKTTTGRRRPGQAPVIAKLQRVTRVGAWFVDPTEHDHLMTVCSAGLAPD